MRAAAVAAGVDGLRRGMDDERRDPDDRPTAGGLPSVLAGAWRARGVAEAFAVVGAAGVAVLIVFAALSVAAVTGVLDHPFRPHRWATEPLLWFGTPTVLLGPPLLTWLAAGAARASLDAVRGDRPPWPRFWSDLPRLWLCGAAGLLTAAGLIGVGPASVFELLWGEFGWSGGAAELAYAVALGIGFAAWFLLLWPVPFLLADRPDLSSLRPFAAAATLPRGRWGGHVAAGFVAFLLYGPAGAFFGLGVPLVAPVVGRILAVTYDRHTRAAGEERR